MNSRHQFLEDLKTRGYYRHMRVVERRSGPYIWFRGRRFLSFASNDYLGLSQHPRVRGAGARAAIRDGMGASSSRLLAGNFEGHQRVEGALSSWLGTEAALVYPTGYLANIGVLTALVEPGDLIFSDALNHASLIDACRLTKAEIVVVPHRDVAWASAWLRRKRRLRRMWIVTESVFSMDGDIAPLVEWYRLAETHGAGLIVDEAHALGVLGRGGRGVVEAMGLSKKPIVVMGTLSKAFGGQGGVVFSSRQIKEWLVNTSRSFIYTTGISPALAASALAAIPILEQGDELRRKVWKVARMARMGFHELGQETGESASPIIPLIVGGTSETMRLSNKLWNRGIYAPGIRPPTVALGSSRIRFTVTAQHLPQHIKRLLSVLREIL